MSIFDRAFKIADETHHSGNLLRYEPFPLDSMFPPWEGAARWRVAPDVWDALRAEAKAQNGFVVPSDATSATLLGYYVVVDEQAAPDLMVLELVP